MACFLEAMMNLGQLHKNREYRVEVETVPKLHRLCLSEQLLRT